MKYYIACSVLEADFPAFRVTGGPFTNERLMDWHVTDEEGNTVAVACDPGYAERINLLNQLFRLLREIDAEYHLSEAHDDGYLNCSNEEWKIFKDLWGKCTSS